MEEDRYIEGGGGAGWPLGLPPVTLQMELANAFSSTNVHPTHSSFLLASPSCCSSLGSSDLDTESSLFSFQARSITLGSLMGIRRSGSEPSSLTRARSLVAASSCSQVSASHPHHNHYHQRCQALELCRKLVRRQQFKHIAMDSAKLWYNFLLRCATCIQAQHKQTCCSSPPCLQPIDQVNAVAVPSLASLLQADRESQYNGTVVDTQAPGYRGLINIMYEGASIVDNPARQSPLCEAPPAGVVARQCTDMQDDYGASRAKSNKRGGTTCFNMGSIKKRVKWKYRELGAHSKSPACIACI